METKTGLDALADDVIKDYQRRQGSRGVWEGYWEEIAELVDPNMRSTFRPNDYITPGDRRTDRQLDSRPTIALSRFAAIMDSLLTPRNQTWHSLRPSDTTLAKNHRIQLYFQQLTTALFRFRYAPAANFASQNHLLYRGLGSMGSHSLFVDTLETGVGFRYKSVGVGETFWKENHQGIVEDIIRRFKLTGDQLVAVKRWAESLPTKVREEAEKNPNKEYFILHRVRPRQDHDPEAPDERAMVYESAYVLEGHRVTISTGGYNSFPYMPSRYDQSPDEVYGRSPAMQAMSAIRTLNAEKRIMLTQGHQAINPTILVHDDGMIDTTQLRPGGVVAGGVNPDGRSLVNTLPVGDPRLTIEMMNQEKEEINAAFMTELFQILVDTPRMTATEVIERTREKGVLIAPTVGRQLSSSMMTG